MQTLKRFLEFKQEILADNSRLYKQSVLKKYAQDDCVKYYLGYIYNPYIITGISTKKITKVFTDAGFGLFDEIMYFNTVADLLEYIAVHNTGTDSILKSIQIFKTSKIVDAELCALLDAIITKTLTLGVDAKTINSIIPGLIPTFNVMLANKYFDNPKAIEGKRFALTTKIDGGRIIAIKDYDGACSFYTRAGQAYIGLVDLEAELNKVPCGTVLDGEITVENYQELDSKEAYKKAMMITRRDDPEKHGLKMLVFDYIPYDEWLAQHGTMIYETRRTHLEALFNSAECLANGKYFELLPVLYSGSDMSQIAFWHKHEVDRHQEGIMINDLDAPYEFKRSNVLLKVKSMRDMDLRIVDFEEGEGRLAGTLGAIFVKYKNNNIVKVGSGFSDELRKEIWENRDRYLGTVCSIQYFEETTNQNGGESLRFPIFIDFRPDLIEAAY